MNKEYFNRIKFEINWLSNCINVKKIDGIYYFGRYILDTDRKKLLVKTVYAYDFKLKILSVDPHIINEIIEKSDSLILSNSIDRSLVLSDIYKQINLFFTNKVMFITEQKEPFSFNFRIKNGI